MADVSFDGIVTDQFDENMALLADALRNKQGLSQVPFRFRADWLSGGGVPSPVLPQRVPHSTRCRRRCRDGRAQRRHSCIVVRAVGASGAQGLLLASALP